VLPNDQPATRGLQHKTTPRLLDKPSAPPRVARSDLLAVIVSLLLLSSRFFFGAFVRKHPHRFCNPRLSGLGPFRFADPLQILISVRVCAIREKIGQSGRLQRIGNILWYRRHNQMRMLPNSVYATLVANRLPKTPSSVCPKLFIINLEPPSLKPASPHITTPDSAVFVAS
jgi:hypothetical protein